jgi:hypothetical protein
MTTFNYSAENLTMQSSSITTIKTQMTIVGTNTELPIECHADFSKIPPHLQESYLNAFLYSFNKGFDIYGVIAQGEPKRSKPTARVYHSETLEDMENEMRNDPWYKKLRHWYSLNKWMFVCYTRKYWDKTLRK